VCVYVCVHVCNSMYACMRVCVHACEKGLVMCYVYQRSWASGVFCPVPLMYCTCLCLYCTCQLLAWHLTASSTVQCKTIDTTQTDICIEYKGTHTRIHTQKQKHPTNTTHTHQEQAMAGLQSACSDIPALTAATQVMLV